MADRHPDHHRLGFLRDRVLRHRDEAPDQAHLRRQLVLRGIHPGHGDAAPRQQPGNPGYPVQVLLGL
ncbi:hypothetical protein D3C78_1898350 [compost metagenome]